MNEAPNHRLQALRRATAPEMVQPQSHRRLGPGYPKRLLRELHRAYAVTHTLLNADTCGAYSPDAVIEAVHNHDRAQHLLAQARRLPRTHLGARARSVALDNADVAQEILEVIASTANRAPRLNAHLGLSW